MPDPESVPFREQLMNMLEEIESESRYSTEARRVVELDQQAIGRLSRMDALANQQLALAQQKRAAAMRVRIKDALRRLDQGEFGYCGECGCEIESARLLRNPTVVTCMECASG